MLSDYIPVYWPDSNTWSIPICELDEYEDYVPEPQDITLFDGTVVRGIPLVHFGTWGLMGVCNVTELLREFAKDPDGTCAKTYKSKKVAADTAAFFKKLVERYPDIVEMTEYREDPESEKLRVPETCIVTPPPPPPKEKHHEELHCLCCGALRHR